MPPISGKIMFNIFSAALFDIFVFHHMRRMNDWNRRKQ